jgi:hypothetical protein
MYESYYGHVILSDHFDRHSIGNPPLSVFGRKHWAEPMPPRIYRCVADLDAAFVQQIHDVSKRKWKASCSALAQNPV